MAGSGIADATASGGEWGSRFRAGAQGAVARNWGNRSSLRPSCGAVILDRSEQLSSVSVWHQKTGDGLDASLRLHDLTEDGPAR
jgi:hypothetical protein